MLIMSNMKKKYTVSSFANKVMARIEFFFARPKLNLFKTLYLNLRCLPLLQALRFPVHVYGALKIYSLEGAIEIEGPIRCGMIKIGLPGVSPGTSTLRKYLKLDGKIIFKGDINFFNGCSICVAPGAVLSFGRETWIGDKAIIHCTKRIELGDCFHSATGLYMIDTNGHYILDIENKSIGSIAGNIFIGEYVWLGNNVSVSKSTILPAHTIVANRSLVNRDYTKSVPEYSIIAGSPAKLVKTGFTRIYNPHNEKMLNEWFDVNGENSVFHCEANNIKEFCYGV